MLLLGEKQEQDIKKLRCPYCYMKLISKETNPLYYRCPSYCLRVWYGNPGDALWSGIRIYGGSSVGLRYYQGHSRIEVYDKVHQTNIDVLDISGYSLKELSNILESHLISQFIIENKKV